MSRVITPQEIEEIHKKNLVEKFNEEASRINRLDYGIVYYINIKFKNLFLFIIESIENAGYCKISEEQVEDHYKFIFRTNIYELIIAIRTVNINRVKELVQKGTYLDSVNTVDNGYTPLMTAVSKNNPECVRILLNAGADYRIKQNMEFIEYDSNKIIKKKMTALDMAIFFKCKKIIAILNKTYVVFFVDKFLN